MAYHGFEAVLDRPLLDIDCRLDPTFRGTMEEGLGAELSGVKISLGRAMCDVRSPLAMTVGSEVRLSPRLGRLPGSVVRAIIAHELVHVVQKQRGLGSRTGPSGAGHDAAIEAEASLGALSLCAGRGFRPRLADAPAVPRLWGPAGHYYTCYFVMLAAGLDSEVARLRAVFCQLPDQALNFDATAAAIDALVSADSLFLREGVRAAGFNTANPWQAGETTDEKRARILQDAQVESGLHSLTGASSSIEQAFRMGVLHQMFNSRDHLAIGLGLHAFGDSFAHVDQSHSAVMYKNGIGHAAELFSVDSQDKMIDLIASGHVDIDRLKRVLADIMLHSHDPDDVTNPKPGRNALYKQYVLLLYIIASAARQRPRMPQALTCELLGTLTQMWTPQGQEQNDIYVIQKIREFAIKHLGVAMAPYQPEHEDQVYFPAYYVAHKQDFAEAGFFGLVGMGMAGNRIRTLAARWARNFTVQSFRP